MAIKSLSRKGNYLSTHRVRRWRRRGWAVVLATALLLTLPLTAQGPAFSGGSAGLTGPETDRLGPDDLALPGGPPPQARLERDDGAPVSHADERDGGAGAPVNRLVLPGGQTFHRTPNPVSALRTLQVPGSSTQLYLWNERLPSGRLQAFYAVSKNGTKLAGRVQATTYQVRLRHHRFDPLAEQLPAAGPALAALPGSNLHLVQLHTTPLPEMRRALATLGGKVLRFLSDHTFLVEMDEATRAEVAELPFVRWIGPYHALYRLEKPLADALDGRVPRLERQRYSILLGERSHERQLDVAALVEGLGGHLELIEPGGLRVEATLDHEQLLALVHADEVQFIDRWGGPGELDMDVVRQVGGADYLEGLEGWTGQGVRGEIFDTELLLNHQEWGLAPIVHSSGTTGSYHGTSCYSINFARGTDPAARGLLPDGQGIFFRYNESTQFGGTVSRYQINQELTDPAGPYRAVFQTSSVGSSRTTAYTTVSAEVDDYLFLHPILSTQSQSNAGNQNSRPQAWAKNIVSVGGIRHLNTAGRSDDYWGFGASIGPAADGRIKPDLAYFYDSIYSARGSGSTSYTQFGGTSAATPETAGYFGLLFQMWHEGVWAGHGGGGDVFDSRPQMATAKALMINHAYRYDWTAGGSNGDLDRFKQGWGTADARRLYDRAAVTSIVDETDLLAPLGVNRYSVQVAAGESELNVTMVYTDPAGTVGAAQARINDLSLRVTSPGGTVYWGNYGLTSGNTSLPGGSADSLNTVENVFLANPQAGTWTVEVLGDEIVQDGHLETPQVDADYALVVSGGLFASDDSLPLPAYERTFSASWATRGYWFTAPTDFLITGLQVPDETGHGLQNVEVVRFDPGVTPPSYSTTTNAFTSLFRATGASSSQVLSTSIPVYAGEVIGILGAAGDSSIMHNSYGDTYPFTSDILGQPVTLRRLGMQYNLASNGARDLWTESFNLARVKMFYAPLGQAPLPAYSNTFSVSWGTRGYWFTAPRDFTIVGLQVPDETAHGLQNVEVVRFAPGVTPPFYSANTNNFTSLLRATGVASNQIIPASIRVRTGETIGILGAAGDGTIMHNSYGATYPFTSDIFGTPVTFRRLGMQYNLATTPAQQVWTESYQLARVKLFYSD